jgi:glycosyltransferase involved in cell wall biosynthesis
MSARALPRILALFGGEVLFGQERGNIEALAALQSQGCEVLCLVRDEARYVAITPALDARGLAWLKVPYIEHRMPGRLHYVIFRNPIAFLRANWRFMKVVREFRPTHIHTFNPLYTLNFLIGLTIHRMPMIYRAGDEPTVHNWVWRAIWRFVVWRTDGFVANSHFVARSLHAHRVAKDRVTVIYNAPPKRDHPLAQLPPLPDPAVSRQITYIGQIAAHKGVHVLVEAFRQVAPEFPASHLVIAGRISDWSGDAWARQLRDDTAADPLLKQRVWFIGEISDVPGLLGASSIHIAPSLFDDPSPNVVCEAKLAACPSIVFPRGGMPELVQDGVNGFVCADATVESLDGALRTYLANPDLALRHGQAALASLTTLEVAKFPQRWLKIYVDAQRHARPPA